MDLANSGYRMKKLLKLTDGRQFRGMINVNTVLRTQNDIAQYLLQVSKNSIVQPGAAMPYDGRKFLLGRGVTEFSADALFRDLRMIEVSHELAWTRQNVTENSISKLPKYIGTISLGTALVCMMATGKIMDSFHTTDSKYSLITNADVQVDDHLGTYVVTFTETRHGLQYAEVR